MGVYYDYDWKAAKTTDILTPASVYPAYLQMDLGESAEKTLHAIKDKLTIPIGVATTANSNTGQQWDFPNVWAPLQVAVLQGANNLGDNSYGYTVARSFADNSYQEYKKNNALFEKYVLGGRQDAGGGEYKMQTGFGWTNATLIYMLTSECRTLEPCVSKLP